MCEKNEVEFWFGNWCIQCRRIRHYLNLYGDRVYEILDNVLSREVAKQDNKIQVEIKTEIETKKYNLRNNNSKNANKDTDESYIKK